MKGDTSMHRVARRAGAVTAIVVGLAAGSIGAQPATLRPAFDRAERLSEWTLDGSGAWVVAGNALVLSKAGVPAGKIRRPAAVAILKSEPFSRATLEVDVKSTAPPDLKVRDVNLIVGYESPTRFYYIHLSAVTDAVHNGIFIVADADRKRIDSGKGEPRLTDQEWHRVRVERDPSTGRIEVYFDGDAAPILQASDTTLQTGRVGVGSFDETAQFRNMVVTGTRAAAKE
jgi:hypothetical protein